MDERVCAAARIQGRASRGIVWYVVCEEHIQGLERRAVIMYDYVSQGLIWGWVAEISRNPPC